MIEVEKVPTNPPNEVTLRFNIIQATSTSQFRSPIHGSRNKYFHYFWFNEEGRPFYYWIDDNTDEAWLKKNIADGRIYIFKDKK